MGAPIFTLPYEQRRLIAAALLELEEDMQAATRHGRPRDPVEWAALKARQRRLDALFQKPRNT